jgi:futalosine hydrolase
MPGKILYTVATKKEGESLTIIPGIISTATGFRYMNHDIELLVTGIGSTATAWSLLNSFAKNGKPQVVLNGGIAGSFRDEHKIGDVVLPVTDLFADLGIEDGYEFHTIYEAGLSGKDEFPFENGIIKSDKSIIERVNCRLPQVNAITVNTATGSDVTKEKLVRKFNPGIETMEGAAFFYICKRERIPFLALRAISNKIELRDKSKWDILLAVDRLSEELGKVLLRLE